MVIWLTGLSASGKTTLAHELHKVLPNSVVIDGDEIRKRVSLGFDKADRDANVMLAASLAQKAIDAGVIPICALISPYRETRAKVRARFDSFIEVFVDTLLEVCEARDPKGLYAKARRGEIDSFTGISSPYEPPINAEVVLRDGTVEEYVSTITRTLSAVAQRPSGSI